MLVANFLFSQKILTSKKGKEPSFSFSIEKFIYLINSLDLSNQEKKTVQICHQHNFNRNTGLKSLGQSRSHILSIGHIKMLAKAGPNGDPTATPSTC